MRTPKQIAASRANGAKSKGPVTPQGKLNSSRNATRHGLLAETIVLETEHADRFLDLLSDLFEEHQPSTPTEIMLVETIAAASWRRSRIWGMQKVAFDYEVASIDTDPNSPALRAVLALRGSAESIRTHELLLRYETALDRQISRSLLRLHQLQDRRARGDGSRDPKEIAVEERTQQPIETIPSPRTGPLATPKPVQSAGRPRPSGQGYSEPSSIPLSPQAPNTQGTDQATGAQTRRKR